ncbi:MAG: TolC family protein [Deltaproteobacteria bacterium]|jgi:outer membrane protein|nr:TolC family protein [Deltaproteobacteria bacterium]
MQRPTRSPAPAVTAPRAGLSLPASLAATAALAALTLAGCAAAERHVISKPYLYDPPSAETIFGEATFGTGASKEAIAGIKPPPPPHSGPLSLDECLEIARRVSPSLDSAQQGELGAMWDRWSSITEFLPTGSTSYSVTQHDKDNSVAQTVGRRQYGWQVSFSQPLFTGGRNVANYYLSQLGVAAAKIQTSQALEDLLLAVKQAYYSILATEKALDVAHTSVVNLQSHLAVAQNFYDVGMSPRNEVLQAEVELANAQLEESTQARNLEVNRARLNILLRRTHDAPLKIKDTLLYPRFPLTLERCLELGLSNNPEIKLGRNQVEAGARNVDMARSALYPQLMLTYSQSSVGSTPRAHGGWSSDSSQWDIAAVASWNFWEWGRAQAGVETSKVALNQAVDALQGLEDSATLEIASNYQTLMSAGRNIDTSAKAVASAAEDLRMVTERYQEQVATNTDVLDAQTRYSEAQYDYFSALYNYNLAWAGLERSLGQRVEPQAAPRSR